MINPVILQEHEFFSSEKTEEYNRLNLIEWQYHDDVSGYFTSYKIGAEWINKEQPLIVTPKKNLEKLDFLQLFYTCLNSNIVKNNFSSIYKIRIDDPPIEAPSLRSVISPLIITHFLSILRGINNLRKDYVSKEGNLKKAKGKIQLIKNELINIVNKRYDRVYCKFNDFTIDNPQNRLIKRALIFSKKFFLSTVFNNKIISEELKIINKFLIQLQEVGENIKIQEVKNIRGNKVYRNYNEAIKLAKIILSYFDYNISNTDANCHKILPFEIDMSLLFENYVYALLEKAYPNNITYQFHGVNQYPDFLFSSENKKYILDTKYKPKYEFRDIEIDDIRQLSGYSRDNKILKALNYTEDSKNLVPVIPCIIIYPKLGEYVADNPFASKSIEELFIPINGFYKFYKIEILLPKLKDKKRKVIITDNYSNINN